MAHDAVNRPSHYAEGREFETIDVIEDWNLGYHLGNAVKYISRAGRKDDILQDLKKAQWYLNREIENLEIERAEVEGTLYELVEEKEEEAREVTYEDIRIDEAWEEAARLAAMRGDDVLDVDDSTLDYWSASRRDLDTRTLHAMCHGQGECGWDPSVGPTC